MAWLETSPVDERLKFVADVMKHEESVSALCSRYGISRKTGYKWMGRYKAEGPPGLEERSRTHRGAGATPAKVERRLVELKRLHLKWGPKKIVDLFRRKYPSLKPPAVSTAGEILKRHGLVVPRPPARRRELRRATPLVKADAPNDSWSTDFKGQFIMGDGAVCYPLTVTDNYSRFLFECRSLPGINTFPVRAVFERLFQEYGLPLSIRSDNGSPFGANRGLAISSLSLWWMQLGIRHERTRAGRPQQNGRHERMHRTLKKAVCSPPGDNARAQQREFDAFRQEYNHERPHEALRMRTPAEVYEPSSRQMPAHLRPLEYPAHFQRRIVGANGFFHFEGKRYFLTKILSGECAGLQPLDEANHRVWAGDLPLGILDLREQCFVAYDEDEQLEAA